MYKEGKLVRYIMYDKNILCDEKCEGCLGVFKCMKVGVKMRKSIVGWLKVVYTLHDERAEYFLLQHKIVQ